MSTYDPFHRRHYLTDDEFEAMAKMKQELADAKAQARNYDHAATLAKERADRAEALVKEISPGVDGKAMQILYDAKERAEKAEAERDRLAANLATAEDGRQVWIRAALDRPIEDGEDAAELVRLATKVNELRAILREADLFLGFSPVSQEVAERVAKVRDQIQAEIGGVH